MIYYKKYRGFTLIELLVVIAVIGILAAIAMVSFTGAQRQARDANRMSDIRMYATALAQYAAKNKGKYPSYTTSVALADLCSTLSLTNCPTDPTDEISSYRYISDGSGDHNPKAVNYVIWSAVESSSNPVDVWVICSTGDTGYWYSGDSLTYSCPALLETPPAETPPTETLSPTTPPTGSSAPTPSPTPTIPPFETPPATITPTSTPACIIGGMPCRIGDTPCCPGYECNGSRCVSITAN